MLQHEIIVRYQNAAHSPYFFKAIIFHNNLSRIVLCNFCISLEIDNDITVVMRTRYEHVTFCFGWMCLNCLCGVWALYFKLKVPQLSCNIFLIFLFRKFCLFPLSDLLFTYCKKHVYILWQVAQSYIISFWKPLEHNGVS